MKRKVLGLLVIIALFISGCISKNVDSLNEELEQLTDEMVKLQGLISEKDEEILQLKERISEITDERDELMESIEMVRFSSYARLNDYNDSFDNLNRIYHIKSPNIIRDDWYIVSGDYFEMELLGYEDANKVDFYLIRLESDEGPILVFTDKDNTDGWIYVEKNINELMNKHSSSLGDFTYQPYFVIYTEVTLRDGNKIVTSKLPIYNE